MKVGSGQFDLECSEVTIDNSMPVGGPDEVHLTLTVADVPKMGRMDMTPIKEAYADDPVIMALVERYEMEMLAARMAKFAGSDWADVFGTLKVKSYVKKGT